MHLGSGWGFFSVQFTGFVTFLREISTKLCTLARTPIRVSSSCNLL